jgi:hypothetical protein
MPSDLNPDKALIFRIVHVDNLPWLLRHGLPCRNSALLHPRYHPIGNPDLIERRQHRVVPLAPGGTLGDYVPFYFTPWSPMLYNIKTGYGGIERQKNDDIAIVVASLPRLDELGLDYVVSDRHAYLRMANFFRDRARLIELPWDDWCKHHFKRDREDPDRFERYQAEALVHGAVPTEALLGIVVYTESLKEQVQQWTTEMVPKIAVRALPGWYFR